MDAYIKRIFDTHSADAGSVFCRCFPLKIARVSWGISHSKMKFMFQWQSKVTHKLQMTRRKFPRNERWHISTRRQWLNLKTSQWFFHFSLKLKKHLRSQTDISSGRFELFKSKSIRDEMKGTEWKKANTQQRAGPRGKERKVEKQSKQKKEDEKLDKQI